MPNVQFIPVAEMAKGSSGSLTKDDLAARKWYEDALMSVPTGQAAVIAIEDGLTPRSISQRVRHAAKRLNLTLNKLVITPENVQFSIAAAGK